MQLEGLRAVDPDIGDVALRESIPRIVRLLENQARLNLGGGLVRVRTGKTLAGLRSRLRLNSSKPSGEVGVYGRRSFVGRLQETGVRAHPIFGRDGGLLTVHVGGRIIRTRMVKHPGFPARHWLSAAVNSVTDDAEREVEKSLERAANTESKLR
jgi:hypothetical protein